MSYVIYEPFWIKMRRSIAKLRGTEDPVVKAFDDQHRRIFNASHGHISSGKDSDESGKNPRTDVK